MRYFLFALALLLPTLANAGEKYDDYRKEMLENGWLPGEKTPNDTCYNYNGGYCASYPEAKDCAGTGAAPCTMIWVRNGETKIIKTIGEKNRVVVQ